MSAVQSIPFATRSQSAADLLAGATKSSKPGKLICTGEVAREHAANFLRLSRQVDELERELNMSKAALIDSVREFHEEQCTRRRTYESSVHIETPLGSARVSFQHRWGKIAANQEPDLRELLNGSYDQLFKSQVSMKLKKEITEDAETLTDVVLEIGAALGAERFKQLFEAEKSLAPTKLFTETQYSLPADTRTYLSLAGVRQVLACSKGGEK